MSSCRLLLANGCWSWYLCWEKRRAKPGGVVCKEWRLDAIPLLWFLDAVRGEAEPIRSVDCPLTIERGGKRQIHTRTHIHTYIYHICVCGEKEGGDP